MIIVDGTTGAIEVLLGGNVATNNLPWTTHWLDVLSSDQSLSTLSHSDGAVTGAGVQTVVASPASGHTRTLKSMTVYNADTTGATVTVRYNNGSATRNLVSVLLSVGDTLEYSAAD